MLLPKKNTIYACICDDKIQFFEEKPDAYDKEIHTKEELRMYLIDKHMPYVQIDEYIRAYFYLDADNIKNLSWVSKPMERIQEKRFFAQNMEEY